MQLSSPLLTRLAPSMIANLRCSSLPIRLNAIRNIRTVAPKIRRIIPKTHISETDYSKVDIPIPAAPKVSWNWVPPREISAQNEIGEEAHIEVLPK
jgi:hypothetical protein